MEKMFETAIRSKMRFAFRGTISVEDLWDLSVQGLDEVYKGLNAQLKAVKEESLLDTKTAADKELETKIEIVKYIVSVKLAEAAAKTEAKAKKEQKQKILEILAEKKDESLKNMTIEQLESMLEK